MLLASLLYVLVHFCCFCCCCRLLLFVGVRADACYLLADWLLMLFVVVAGIICC